MTEQGLQEIKERLEKATPGPWKQEQDGYVIGAVNTNYHVADVVSTEMDAEFIAHAPTDIRRLLEEVERLNKAFEYAGKAIYTQHCTMNHMENTDFEKGQIDGLITASRILEKAKNEIEQAREKNAEQVTKLQAIQTDGWLIKVGDVYSNGYEALHLKVTGIVLEEGDGPDDAWIHYDMVDPRNHNEVVHSGLKGRAWYINECWFK